MQTMTVNVVLAADVLLVTTFVSVCLLAAVRAPRSGPAGWWVAAAFGAVSLALTGFTLPEHADVQLPPILAKALIVALLSFPYLLLRFTAAFSPLPRWLEVPWGAVALGVALLTLLLPVIPEPGADLPSSIYVYVGLVLAFWLVSSVVVVTRLLRAGRGQPTVARRRMFLMACATGVLTVALLVAAPLGEEVGAVGSAVRLGTILSGAIFAFGFAPPPSLRVLWRRPEVEALQQGRLAVLGADTAEEVMRELLPPMARIVNASRVVVVDADGDVAASVGSAAVAGVTPAVIDLPRGHGQLRVWTSPYTPFFGPDEIRLLHDMAAVAGLALDRCALLHVERSRRVALEAAQRDLIAAQQEADRANEAKSAFLSRMSHELRTPLNAILGFGQVLEAGDGLEPRDRDAVGHITKAGRHLLDLINEVLNLSRIEAGEMDLSPEPVVAADLLTDAVGLIQPLAERARVAVAVVDNAPGAVVLADVQRCRQVLLNLLGNAVKYHHDGGGSVEVACGEGGGGTIRFAVTDDGPGIASARQAGLFEPFDRLGAERSTVEGTGLGLALSKQLVELMGGRIGVESAPGSGSTFWIELPAVNAPAPTPAAP